MAAAPAPMKAKPAKAARDARRRRNSPARPRPRRRCPTDTVVWVNTKSQNLSLLRTIPSYGTTKQGAYMCEADATAAGAAPPRMKRSRETGRRLTARPPRARHSAGRFARVDRRVARKRRSSGHASRGGGDHAGQAAATRSARTAPAPAGHLCVEPDARSGARRDRAPRRNPSTAPTTFPISPATASTARRSISIAICRAASLTKAARSRSIAICCCTRRWRRR